jgi:Fe-S-cluster containining protein
MLAPWKDLVTTIHARFDGELGPLLTACRERGGRSYCAAGCGGCCTLNVGATLAEALVVAGGLQPSQIAAVADYLDRLRLVLTEAASLKDFLRRHRQSAGPCPFLNDRQQCGIYSSRPLACRALFSTRNSAWCGVDFADLHPAERRAFMSSLDPALVAFPTHFLAAPQELARKLELELEGEAIARSGYSLTGNLPLLVELCRNLDLAAGFPPLPRLKTVLAASGLAHPFAVTLVT